MNPFQLAWKNMMHQKTLSFLSILAVTLASGFITFLSIIEKGIQEGATTGYDPFELVIGAEGSDAQLMLNTFYHIGTPVGNISYDVWTRVERMHLAETAYPMTRGDSLKGFPLIGISAGYLTTKYPKATLTGNLYKKTGEVVIGAHVAKHTGLQIGDTFHANHGLVEAGDTIHANMNYTVVGILSPVGTADDKALFTTVDHAWVAHEQDMNEGDLTAIVVQPKGLMELQQMANWVNEIEGVQAVYSGKTISYLLATFDTGAKFVGMLSVVAIVLAIISILLALTAVTVERRKDIGLLRLLGKSRHFILMTIVIEGVYMTVGGALCGILIGKLGSAILQQIIFSYAGVVIDPWQVNRHLWIILAGAFLIGVLISMVVAIRSYKVDPIILFR